MTTQKLLPKSNLETILILNMSTGRKRDIKDHLKYQGISLLIFLTERRVDNFIFTFHDTNEH